MISEKPYFAFFKYSYFVLFKANSLESKDYLQVCLRIRPFTQSEKEHESEVCGDFDWILLSLNGQNTIVFIYLLWDYLCVLGLCVYARLTDYSAERSSKHPWSIK